MRRVLFLFLDGIGLGEADPQNNPLVAARMPTLERLLLGHRMVAGVAPLWGPMATLLAVDAQMGIPHTPQSASGQASLLTGLNVPREIGGHYGPKPNQAIADILRRDNLFMQVKARGGSAALLNAYPPGYFSAIDSGRRLYSAIPLAVTAAGFRLMTADDLGARRALSADFTGAGWASQPSFPPAPVYEPEEAGRVMARVASTYNLSWFDYWASDYAGHHQDAAAALQLMESFDRVVAGVLDTWDVESDLIVLTSDHGNMEDLSTRGHTPNPVPALLIGPDDLRRRFAEGLTDLTGFTPAVLDIIFGEEGAAPGPGAPSDGLGKGNDGE
jgi:2,3-bisphosphoglycerate-independent phosphoglycerate mutase